MSVNVRARFSLSVVGACINRGVGRRPRIACAAIARADKKCQRQGSNALRQPPHASLQYRRRRSRGQVRYCSKEASPLRGTPTSSASCPSPHRSRMEADTPWMRSPPTGAAPLAAGWLAPRWGWQRSLRLSRRWAGPVQGPRPSRSVQVRACERRLRCPALRPVCDRGRPRSRRRE